MGKFELMALPYAPEALEPVIMVPIAALAWYRLQCYTWYRYSDISK
jgi:hypothetical protein